MKFSIFGLGDTSYEQYNEMGKEFDAGFEELGGQRVHEMACGNAETFSTEDDFNKWKENLWVKIFDLYSSQQSDEQKKKALIRHSSFLEESSKVDKNQLPWALDTSGIQLEEDKNNEPEYDMNMRHYLSSKPLKIKSMRQLRQ